MDKIKLYVLNNSGLVYIKRDKKFLGALKSSHFTLIFQFLTILISPSLLVIYCLQIF